MKNLMSDFEFLTEAETHVLENIAGGIYGDTEGSIASAGGWSREPADLLGTFCSTSRPGSSFRRLIDMGLVVEYREECKRVFGWKWSITKPGRALLDLLKAKQAEEAEDVPKS